VNRSRRSPSTLPQSLLDNRGEPSAEILFGRYGVDLHARRHVIAGTRPEPCALGSIAALGCNVASGGVHRRRPLLLLGRDLRAASAQNARLMLHAHTRRARSGRKRDAPAWQCPASPRTALRVVRMNERPEQFYRSLRAMVVHTRGGQTGHGRNGPAQRRRVSFWGGTADAAGRCRSC